MTRKPSYSNGTGIRRVYSAESWKDMLLHPVYVVPMHPLTHQTVLVVSYLQYLQRLLQCALCPKHDDCCTMSTEVKVVASSTTRLADVASCYRLLFCTRQLVEYLIRSASHATKNSSGRNLTMPNHSAMIGRRISRCPENPHSPPKHQLHFSWIPRRPPSRPPRRSREE